MRAGTRGHFRSCDKDSGHMHYSIRHNSQKPMQMHVIHHANLMALCFIEPKLRPFEVIHCENGYFQSFLLLWLPYEICRICENALRIRQGFRKLPYSLRMRACYTWPLSVTWQRWRSHHSIHRCRKPHAIQTVVEHWYRMCKYKLPKAFESHRLTADIQTDTTKIQYTLFNSRGYMGRNIFTSVISIFCECKKPKWKGTSLNL